MKSVDIGKTYFVDEADWSDLQVFIVMSETQNTLGVCDLDGNWKDIPIEIKSRLKLHPTSLARDSKAFAQYKFVQDTASALIRQNEKIEIPKLIDLLHKDGRARLSTEVLTFVLKALVASNSFAVKSDTRMKVKEIYLILGKQREESEKRRMFAASIASELDDLSARIRLIISHSGTVGTYRENLLQNVLRKNLPERYHVATGFIYGCSRQLDVVIYDRLEYAPLFREGDLVVVPPNAVRAVIEVKTGLTANELRESLHLLSGVAVLDDSAPPIFKGVFAFESKLSEEALCQVIKEYYVADRFSEDCTADVIMKPFAHFTCACVLEKHFVYTRYSRNSENMVVPSMFTKKSNSGLKSQAAFFMQSLLAHLRYGGVKNNHLRHMDDMLGSDTISAYYCDLVDGEWGVYFLEANGALPEDETVEAMEELVGKVQGWLDGAPLSWRNE
ncbi:MULTISPECIES: DUF6602 domain-containing protein [Pseudomonas]|uniref:DUF6602 domain-containing protein n=1 Tax=Pseudomonas quercus TaxID=2722792 RepID=A0ABX0Y975_9PSED|nr:MULTISPECIES: DUF6602 domain-containing protein [Pseudomonas]MBF7141339.1 hypothetical protein [Pseudomonas sp. LY10J]NJO99877.1 hypothetical protein [Pseudomonas quercus]